MLGAGRVPEQPRKAYSSSRRKGTGNYRCRVGQPGRANAERADTFSRALLAGGTGTAANRAILNDRV